jgi:hypothetical protein
MLPFPILSLRNVYLLELVRDINGERHEYNPQISPFDVRLTPGREARRGECTPMGK